MADPRDGQGLVAADDLGESGEVGACRQRERLSSDRDRDDVVAGQSEVEGPVQLAEPMCAQGIRSSVTTPVVQRDQHRSSRSVRQRDVPTQRPSDDFTLTARRGLNDQLLEIVGPHAATSTSEEKWGFSQITVPPMPRPIHIVVSP
jgi:hypothetical protein